MECTLAALVACFSWSGFYVDAGIQAQDHGETWIYATYDGDRLNSTKKVDWQSNPYGRFGLGYEINFKSLTWRVEASHTSSLTENRDGGINTLSVSARWFPFR
jgi:hypothetical protein